MDPTEEDLAIISKIAERAIAYFILASETGRRLPFDGLDIQMDLCAVHLNGCPLRLADLLAADDFNFAHDITGIRRHLNRKTGALENHFLPRFAKKGG